MNPAIWKEEMTTPTRSKTGLSTLIHATRPGGGNGVNGLSLR